jgi:hypothetical protein
VCARLRGGYPGAILAWGDADRVQVPESARRRDDHQVDQGVVVYQQIVDRTAGRAVGQAELQVVGVHARHKVHRRP